MIPNILIVVCAYLVGSLSFAIIVSHFMGMADPRSYGSGNPGATNVLRSGRKIAAILTLLGDALKGWVMVWISIHFAIQWHLSDTTIALVAVAVLAGHMWPIFFHFKGGKGVATALGVLLALSWPVALICAGIWLVMAVGLKISSLSALIATISCPISSYFFIRSTPIFIAVIVIAILILFRHKSNILKLIQGTESKIGN